MNTVKMLRSLPVLALVCAAGLQFAETSGAKANKRATPTISVRDLRARRGPTPPVGSTYLGVESQPAVGQLALPIRDVPVYQFEGKTQTGNTIPVHWAYSQGAGTYMWGTAPIQCENDKRIERGGFVIHVHDDGSGGYMLGSNQCPVGAVYGCKFDNAGNETQCGTCVWTRTELTCEQS
jgi:hypothetical protein